MCLLVYAACRCSGSCWLHTFVQRANMELSGGNMHTKKEQSNICADFTVCRAATVPLVTLLRLWMMCSCSILKWSGVIEFAVHAGVSVRSSALRPQTRLMVRSEVMSNCRTTYLYIYYHPAQIITFDSSDWQWLRECAEEKIVNDWQAMSEAFVEEWETLCISDRQINS